jgi:hypothetical protein
MNIKNKSLWLVPLLVGSIGMSAQAQDTSKGKSASSTANFHKEYQSGFLKDYSKLKPEHGTIGRLFFADKKFDFKPFTKIMFDPIEVLPVSKDGADINPEAAAKLKKDLLAAYTKALEPGYQVVDAPGPDVLRVRCAITGVNGVRGDVTPVDFVPMQVVYKGAKAAAGKSTLYTEMKGEVEVLSPEGKQVAAASAKRRSADKLAKNYTITWEAMNKVMDAWAQNFRTELDKLRGVAKK